MAARDYSKASAADVGVRCGNDAQNVYNQCVANSTDVQNQSDRVANAAFINSSGVAYATYKKTVITSDSYTALVCNQNASTAYANCVLSNSCADGCAKTQNSDYLAAYVVNLILVGPAYAQYNYDTIMCSVSRPRDDQSSYAQYGYAIDIANTTYNYNQTVAWNLYQYTHNIDADQHTRDVDLCACNSTNDSQYNSCVATANATQVASDNNALAVYQQKANVPPSSPTGDNWNIWNQAYTNADNALQAAYATHSLSEQTCVQNKLNTYNAIYNSASTAYNNAMNSAGQKYQDCLKGCTNG